MGIKFNFVSKNAIASLDASEKILPLELKEVRENLPSEFQSLTDEEITTIQSHLVDKLSVGSCGLCV